MFSFIILMFAAILAFYKKALTLSGAIAMEIIGLATVLAFDYRGLLLLAIFFITANLMGRWPNPNEDNSLDRSEPKRTYLQVLANGFMALVASIGQLIDPSPFWYGMFIGAVAEANADTWASEIGVTSIKAPWSIMTWKKLPPGVSGGISSKGLWASFFGACLISLTAITLWPVSFASWSFFVLFTSVGFIGALFDSLLGAKLQVSYVCQVCQNETDHSIHCGVPAIYKKGFKQMTNSAVNFVSVLFFGLLSGGMTVWL